MLVFQSSDVSLGSGGELMFAEQIAMIMQQFGYEQTQLLWKVIVDTLLTSLYEKPLTKIPIATCGLKKRYNLYANVAFRSMSRHPYRRQKIKLLSVDCLGI